MSESELFKARRTAKSDPALGRQALFCEEINQRLATELPPEVRATLRFTRATMPTHWLEAVLQNGESYRRRDKSVAMDFQSLPPAMAIEFAWAIERQVQLGMHIDAEATAKLSQQIALVAVGQRHGGLASLLDLSCDEWIHAIRKIRIRRGDPLAPNQLNRLRSSLGRFLDILVHAYHQGDWWELNVWNPVLDTRIPLRVHEPRRHNLVYFSHLTTPWLREAAKWWLARQLERQVFVWTTVHTRQHNLVWFQRYLDRAGCDGPLLTDDERQLGQWVQDFRQWLGRQKCAQGPTKGQPARPHPSPGGHDRSGGPLPLPFRRAPVGGHRPEGSPLAAAGTAARRLVPLRRQTLWGQAAAPGHHPLGRGDQHDRAEQRAVRAAEGRRRVR